MITVTLGNVKGGSSKSSTALSLAHSWAMSKKRVLLLDVDAQCSLSHWLGFDRSQLEPSTYDIFVGSADAADCVRPTHLDNVDIITASKQLSGLDLVLASQFGRERILLKSLSSVADDFDICVIDTPPSPSLQTVNSLVASDFCIVPILASYLSLNGCVDMLHFMQGLREGIGQCAQLLGILITQIDRRKRSTDAVIEQIRHEYKRDCFKHTVPISSALELCPSFHQTIFEYDARSRVAASYHAIAREALRRMKERRTP